MNIIKQAPFTLSPVATVVSQVTWHITIPFSPPQSKKSKESIRMLVRELSVKNSL